ncbi:nSTAND1 domain-containing NTPase [Streptomyces sp. NPDC001595]|uniref:nSTAND1 domain-containing NTPase n=1 Tax=Streptomyces sp. NPDC001532 TaxID=3154520 RepID=UPI00331C0AE4
MSVDKAAVPASPARAPAGLGAAVVRVRGGDGRPVGTGFLLAPGTIATCAHVVADALRTDPRSTTPPTTAVTVEFPLRPGAVTYQASVTGWRAVGTDGTGDIALLRLPEGAPADPVPLAGVQDVWHHRFRILGFPASAEHGAWIGGRLLDEVGQGWVSMESDGSAHRIGPGCSGAPVWDEAVGAVVGMTVATDRGAGAVTSYLIPAAALIDLQPGLRRCPYRGLDAFREEDAEHFFGREEETRRLLDAVDRHLVVPVVGPSGSGKTSLVRAGALPRLRADGHTVSEIRPLPGTRASLTVARAVIGALGVREAEEVLEGEVPDGQGALGEGALGEAPTEAAAPKAAEGALAEASEGAAGTAEAAETEVSAEAPERDASAEAPETEVSAEARETEVPAEAPEREASAEAAETVGAAGTSGGAAGASGGAGARPVPGPRAAGSALAAVEQERAALTLADLLDSADGPTPAELGRRVLDHCGPRGHVFFLNQLEEIVAAEPATARALLSLMAAVVSAPGEGRRLRVLVTLRSACLDDLADPATARVLSDCAQIVAPLGRSGLLRAVEGPAARVPGLTLEPGLAERIVDDAQDEPGHLPLVEFTLTELWAHEKGVRLTHAGYDALGGVAGALSAHAEQRVGEVVTAHGEAPVRRLFTRLARPDDAGGFTRKPAPLTPLPPDIRAAAEALATHTRFVRITHGPDGDPIVDLAHEELVRAWPRLREWLEASRDFRSWQERLLEALAHWKETGEEPGALLRGTMLATSVEHLGDPVRGEDVTQPERDYVELSRRHQQRALRRWRAATAVMVVLALLAGYLGIEMWRGMREQDERVRTMASRQLVEDAQRLAATDPGTAARLSLAAWHHHRGPEARQALLQAYLGGMSVISGDPGQGSEPIRSIDLTPDGSAAVTTSVGRDGAPHARVWTGLGDGRASWWQVPDLTGGAPERAELSDDGELLAVVTADGSLHCYDVRARTRLWTAPPPATKILRRPATVAVDFSDSGRLLLRLTADPLAEDETAHSSHVQVWRSRTKEVEQVSQRGLPSGPKANDAALVGEGRQVVLLSWSENRAEARVQDLATGANPHPIANAQWISHRGAGVVVDRDHGRHQLIRLTAPDATEGRRSLALGSEGPDLSGRYLVSRAATQVSQFELVDLETGRRYRVPGVPSSGVQEDRLSVGVLPGEEAGAAPRLLVASGSDLLVVRTEEERGSPLPRAEPSDGGPDGSYLRSPGGEHRARVETYGDENGTTVRLVVARRGEEDRAEPVTAEEFGEDGAGGFFTADGSRLVLWGSDKVSVRDPDSPRQARVRSFPDLEHAVPLRGGEVVLQTRDRLIRYDVASDEASVLGTYPCDALGDPCVGMAVRPGERAEVIIGHRSGEVAFWDPGTGRVRRNTGITVAGADDLLFAFDPRGRTVATKLDGRTVQRWDVETGRRLGPAVEAEERVLTATLATDGTLLTNGPDDSGLVLRRPEDGDTPFVTFPFAVDFADLRLSAGRLTVRQRDSALTIPLDPDAWHEALCRHWTPYTEEERKILEHAGAEADSPCP